MAKLKATPKNYTQAVEALNGKQSIRLGNNTYLERHFCGIFVRLHSTNIVLFHENGCVCLFTGGCRTVTTKDRINEFIDGHIYQSAGEWYYTAPNGQPNGIPIKFTEGMIVA